MELAGEFPYSLIASLSYRLLGAFGQTGNASLRWEKKNTRAGRIGKSPSANSLRTLGKL